MGDLLALIEMEKLQRVDVLSVVQEDQEILLEVEYYLLKNSLKIEKK